MQRWGIGLTRKPDRLVLLYFGNKDPAFLSNIA